MFSVLPRPSRLMPSFFTKKVKVKDYNIVDNNPLREDAFKITYYLFIGQSELPCVSLLPDNVNFPL